MEQTVEQMWVSSHLLVVIPYSFEGRVAWSKCYLLLAYIFLILIKSCDSVKSVTSPKCLCHQTAVTSCMSALVWKNGCLWTCLSAFLLEVSHTKSRDTATTHAWLHVQHRNDSLTFWQRFSRFAPTVLHVVPIWGSWHGVHQHTILSAGWVDIC